MLWELPAHACVPPPAGPALNRSPPLARADAALHHHHHHHPVVSVHHKTVCVNNVRPHVCLYADRPLVNLDINLYKQLQSICHEIKTQIRMCSETSSICSVYIFHVLWTHLCVLLWCCHGYSIRLMVSRSLIFSVQCLCGCARLSGLFVESRVFRVLSKFNRHLNDYLSHKTHQNNSSK